MSLLKKIGISIGLGKLLDWLEGKGWARESDRPRAKSFLSAFVSSLVGLEKGELPPEDEVIIELKNPRKSRRKLFFKRKR